MIIRSSWMRLAAVALTTAGVVACVPSARASVAPSTRPGAAPIVWGACPAGTDVDPAQTCATLKVPLDHRRPHGRTIDLAISRIPASNPAKRRGVLLLNPGGPGAEGLTMPGEFGELAPEAVLDSYDRIGFDPRGVGHSTPVSCGLTAAELLPDIPLPGPDGSIAANVAFARSAARRCAARSGDLLPFMTTANTARDMDLVRHALGESRISYWGGSYGTYLGAVYASLFPGRTDRFVLDSAVDPTRVWYDTFRQQSAGMAARFPDAARYAADNVATIAMGRSVPQVTRTYLALARRLDSRPAAIPGSPTVLTGNVLRYVTFTLLAQDATLPVLAQAWRAATDLAAGSATAEQADLLRRIVAKLLNAEATSPGVPADNELAAGYAVLCGDTSWPRDLRVYAQNVAKDRARYPLSAGVPANLWPCAFWASRPVEPPVTVTGRGPRNILILQNDRDPLTPPASARGMRRAFGHRAALVTVAAGGHGVYGTYGPGSCADDIANAFLTRGRLPAGDVRCPKP